MRNFLLVAVSIMLILSCAQRDGEIQDRNNIFDPGGDNWTENQLPVITDYSSTDPSWISFNFTDSTGFIQFRFSAYDADENCDTLSFHLLLTSDTASGYYEKEFWQYDSLFDDSTLSGISMLFVDGIIPGEKYYYKIIASDMRDGADTAEGFFNSPDGMPPKPPANFTVYNGPEAVLLLWSIEMTDSIIIYRSGKLSGPYIPIDTLLDTVYYDYVSTYDIYYYMIASFNMYGKNYSKDTLPGRIFNPDLPPPNPPFWDGYTYNDSIVVGWVEPEGVGFNVEGYEVYRASKPMGPYYKIGEAPTSDYYSEFTDHNVPSTDDYYYKYSYYTNKGSSDLSVHTSGNIIRLSATLDIEATQGTLGKQIKITWETVSGADGYLLYRYIEIDDEPTDTIFVDTVTDTTYFDTPPTDTTYYYFVAGYSSRGRGDYSDDCYGHIMKIPDSLKIDTSNVTHEQIALSWQGNLSYQNYIIYRSIDSVSFTPIDTPYITSYNCNYYDTNISTEEYVRYYYRVTRYLSESGEESYPTNIVSASLYPAPLSDTLQAVEYPDSVVLIWGKSSGATSYNIYRALYEYAYYQEDFEMLTSTADTFYTVTDSIDTVFYYKVVGVNNMGEGEWDNEYGIPVQRLFSPVDLEIDTVYTTDTQIALAWTSDQDYQDYIIYRSTDNIEFDPIDTTNISYTSCSYYDTIMLAQEYTLYYYYVTKFISETGVESNPTNEVSGALFPSDLSETLSAVQYPDSVVLTWGPSAHATSYIIYRSLSDGAYAQSEFDSVISVTDTTYTVTDSIDSVFYYKVAGVNDMGCNWQNEYGVPVVRLFSPHDLEIDTLNTTYKYITFTWISDLSDQYYIIYRSTDSSLFAPIDTPLIVSENCSFTDSTIPAGDYTRYYYKVTKYIESTGIETYPTNIVSGTMKPSPLADTLTALQYSDSVVLIWGASEGATSYNLYRSLYSDASDKSEFTLFTTVEDTSYSVTDSLDTTFYYKVVGVNSMGETEWEDKEGIGVIRLFSPYDLIIDTTYTTFEYIALTWKSDLSNQNFIIYRSTDSSTFTPIDTHLSSYIDCYYTDSTISSGDYTRYYYKVTKFIEATGIESNPTNTIGATLMPGAITDTMSAVQYPDSVVLTWGPAQGATSYHLYRTLSAAAALKEGFDFVISVSDTFYCVTDSLDTTFYYKVVGANSMGEAEWDEDVYSIPVTRMFPPSSGTISVNESAAHLEIIIEGFEGSDGYIIHRSTDSLDFTVLDTVDTTIYYDTVTTGDYYYYKVEGYNIAGTSEFSNTSEGAKRHLPGITDAISATDGIYEGENCILVTWSVVEGTDTYIIFKTTSGETDKANYTTLVDSTVDTFYVDTVQDDSIYFYRVLSTNAVGSGVLCNVYDGGYRQPLTVPDPPIMASASNNYSDRINITWNKPDSGAHYTGYIVYSCNDDSSGTFEMLDTIFVTENKTSYSDYSTATKTCTLGETWYRVTAYNIKGESIMSNAVAGCRN